MAVSDHDSKPDGAPAPHPDFRQEIEMQPPAPPRLVIPIILLLTVTAAVAATVLLANGGRNIRLLAESLHIGWQPAARNPLASTTAPQAPPQRPAHPAALLGNLLAPPQPLEPAIQPETFCRSFAKTDQEAPEFTPQTDGSWECSLLRNYPTSQGTSSAFFQIRGSAQGLFSSFRIKFSLAAGGMTASILDEALLTMRRSIRPGWSDDGITALLGQKLEERKDFSFLAGYYPASFKHELSDPNRLNLIVVNRPVPRIEPFRLPASWIAMVPQHRPVKPQRGPRLLTASPS